jgi:Fur family transcriptional regulator, ferric uptake regulator
MRRSRPSDVTTRATRQRAAIARALNDASGFRTAQELFDELRSAGQRVGLTTIYRTLQSLAERGEVDVLRTAEGEAIYRRCVSENHHHHLVCSSCGLSVEIASAEVERWARQIAVNHGFSSITHTAEVFGLCRECSRDEPVHRL